MSIGDQVKIIAVDHPWSGAIGRIVAPGAHPGYWHVELETIHPGHWCAAFETELKRV